MKFMGNLYEEEYFDERDDICSVRKNSLKELKDIVSASRNDLKTIELVRKLMKMSFNENPDLYFSSITSAQSFKNLGLYS